MKMDFPNYMETNSGDRSRARFATLIACAVNRQLAGTSGFARPYQITEKRMACDALQSRINYFGRLGDRTIDVPVGAFLPTARGTALVNGETESGVYLDASANGKPNDLGSSPPGYPEIMRGMEN